MLLSFFRRDAGDDQSTCDGLLVAAATGLSGYDAALAAAAELVAAPLITSDDRLAEATAAGVHLRAFRS